MIVKSCRFLLLRKGARWEVSRLLSSQAPTFVSTSWLHKNYEQPSVRVVHASWSRGEDFMAARIPSASCFDGLACRDKDSPYKNTLPSPDLFQSHARELGVSGDTHVVVYDMSPTMPSLDLAPRVWFLFRLFGHPKVSLLEGGLLKWLKEQRPMREGPLKTPRPEGDFVAKLDSSLIRSFEQVVALVEAGEGPIVDARPQNQYEGEVVSPFGLDGHIPGSINIPLSSVLDAEAKTPKCQKEMALLFKGIVNSEAPPVVHCNTGLHGCGVLAAAHSIGIHGALYDGSWQEWAHLAKDKPNLIE